MARRLLIVESPTKALTLQRLLGSEWVVRATSGHVKDLPEGRLAIDRFEDFTPVYQVLRGKGHVLQSLGKEARLAEEVILATDPDREGEAIAWHVVEELGLEGTARRARIHELTPSAVDRALAEAGPLDRARTDAQQARRILDRLVGYGLSPLLSRKIGPNLSAGRVQSAALHLLVQRERERRAFQVARGWNLVAEVKPRKGRSFLAGTSTPLSRGEAESVARALGEEGTVRVERVRAQSKRREAPPPYVTASLQQDGFSLLRFSVTKTMRLAQRLFEGVALGDAGTVSLITYVRTDSPRVSGPALDAARRFAEENFGEAGGPSEGDWAHPPGSQLAHGGIRPVSVEITPELVKPHLDRDAHRLYDGIWRRFVASQMKAAVYEDVEIVLGGTGISLSASSLSVAEKGFLVLWGEKAPSRFAKETEAWEAKRPLPALEVGEALGVSAVEVVEWASEPPSRYTEATLLAVLEERGLGRPSTWASILETLLDRGYVVRGADGLTPTPLGERVDEVLFEAVGDWLSPSRTAEVEEAIDSVASGERDWLDVVKSFYLPFEERLASAMPPASKSRRQVDESCERCGEALSIRWGRMGPFLSCSAYPKCRFTRDLGRPGEQGSVVVPGGPGAAVAPEEPVAPVRPTPQGSCPRCGAAMIERRGRNGPFLACSAYPACKTSLAVSTGVPCPACGEGEIAEKRSRAGRLFFGCNRFPACDHAMRERPIPGTCRKCGAGYLVQRFSRREGAVFVCVQEGCGHHRPVAEGL